MDVVDDVSESSGGVRLQNWMRIRNRRLTSR